MVLLRVMVISCLYVITCGLHTVGTRCYTYPTSHTFPSPVTNPRRIRVPVMCNGEIRPHVNIGKMFTRLTLDSIFRERAFVSPILTPVSRGRRGPPEDIRRTVSRFSGGRMFLVWSGPGVLEWRINPSDRQVILLRRQVHS